MKLIIKRDSSNFPPDFGQFYQVAQLLEEGLDVQFINKIDGFETSYWDFSYHNEKLTLHYNAVDGVSIFPVVHSKKAGVAILSLTKNIQENIAVDIV